MQIAETVGMKMGKNIYSQMNGLVTPDHCRMWAMMAGYTAAAEMDKKRIYHQHGMEKRASLGLHGGTTPWFHRTVRDPDNGRALRVELREEYRYIWDAVFKVIVTERVGFGYVERDLFEKYQIVNPVTGRPFRLKAIYEVLCMNPSAWGHRYQGKKLHKRNHEGGLSGEWVYDRTVPPPDDIKLHYDVLPAIYTGQQAAAMIDELRRRKDIQGGGKPTHPSTFAGLVVCDYCDNHMVYTQKVEKNWQTYRCQTHDRLKFAPHMPDCPCKPKVIRFQKLVDWLRPFLEKLIAGESLDTLFPLPASTVEDDIASLEQQLMAVTAEKTRLVERLGLIPDSMLQDYQHQMQQVAERADALQGRLNTLRTVNQSHNRGSQVAARDDLLRIGLDAFWALDAGQQQQILKRLFARWRIIVADGEVIGVAQAGRRSSRWLRERRATQ